MEHQPADYVDRAASVNPSITPKIGDANKIYFMYVPFLLSP